MNRGTGQETDTADKGLSHLTLPTTFVLLTALIIFLFFGAAKPLLAQEGTVHIVQPGENLSSIAKIYGVTVAALSSYNGIVNPNLLRTGYALRIPPLPSTRTKVEATVAPPPTKMPTVPAPTPRPTSTPTRPTSTPTPQTPRIHVVNAGQTLSSIATMYGTSVRALKARNGLTRDTVFRGQRLIIP